MFILVMITITYYVRVLIMKVLFMNIKRRTILLFKGNIFSFII